MKKKRKCYVIVREEQKDKVPPKFIEGVFPLTEEGKIEAERYAKKISSKYKKYKVSEL